jgi:uncharacterized protein with NRDE domain
VCLAVLALNCHPRWPLVIAANRDEYHDRATAALHWWDDSEPRVLAGKDLAAGGTWMGANAAGRLALLTNVRDPSRQRANAPSRGALVSHWLRSASDAEEAARHAAAMGCNPFNLLLADQGGQRWWYANEHTQLERLADGVHGLSNARLNTAWPKVQRLKATVANTVDAATELENLVESLFNALADRTPAPDEQLPSTGVGLPIERYLSSAFIAGQSLGRAYGTRSSTVLLVQNEALGATLCVQERNFDAWGHLTTHAAHRVPDWPWKYKGPEPEQRGL